MAQKGADHRVAAVYPGVVETIQDHRRMEVRSHGSAYPHSRPICRLCRKSLYGQANRRYRSTNAILIIPPKFFAVFSNRENTRRHSFS